MKDFGEAIRPRPWTRLKHEQFKDRVRFEASEAPGRIRFSMERVVDGIQYQLRLNRAMKRANQKR